MNDFIQNIVSRESANYDVQVIADSIWEGKRITTLQLRYPRFIHAEMMTHKRFSRNASSSRARPVNKEIERIRSNPAMPIYWGKNRSGMQAKKEFNEDAIKSLESSWLYLMNQTIASVEYMQAIGAANWNAEPHKQTLNRLLEPYQLVEVVVTATSFEEFFKLRIHEDAQPEIIKLAYMMREALNNSEPSVTIHHLPYISTKEYSEHSLVALMDISSARCARVSYKLFDGTTNIEKDIELANKLFGGDTPHASPAEHPSIASKGQHANFDGWKNYRTILKI